MKSTRLLILSFVVALVFGLGQLALADYDANYDYDGTTDLDTDAGNTLIHDLDVIKDRAIDNIIRRIRRGDPNVLKFVVYDVLAEVHRRIIEQIEDTIDPSRSAEPTTDYYQQLGNEAALQSFIGGFDNQDPKVRLRCIGFLGDWVDDIGERLPMIGFAANQRLNSAIETREEVKYGLTLLQLKVLRKIDLNAIFNGDERRLAEIEPDEFVVLVQGEPFIRQIFCVPPDVILRSIRLNPWWIDDRGFIRMRSENEEMEKFTVRQFWTSRGFPQYVHKLNETNSVYRNYPSDESDMAKRYGYKDRAGYLDIVSLYDTRYFRYSDDPTDTFPNEERFIPSIFMGLSNPSLFVRENCARILVRLSDGPLPYDPTDPAASGASAVFEDISIITNREYEEKNTEGQVIGVRGILGQMASNERYRNVLRTAWKNVKFAQFVDVHQQVDPVRQTRQLNPTAGAITIRDLDNDHGNATDTLNPWGYTYNYRTDVADLMRRMGLGRLVDTCAMEETEAPRTEGGRRYFVEDLMDLDALTATGATQPIPRWHGRDEIRDEVFE